MLFIYTVENKKDLEKVMDDIVRQMDPTGKDKGNEDDSDDKKNTPAHEKRKRKVPKKYLDAEDLEMEGGISPKKNKAKPSKAPKSKAPASTSNDMMANDFFLAAKHDKPKANRSISDVHCGRFTIEIEIEKSF